MEAETLLGVLGLVATVAFGALSLGLFVRRRYPGELTFFGERTISLFDEIVKNIPDLTILYQSRPISEGLVFFSGLLVNTGALDITPEMVVSPVRLRLPGDFSWVQSRIVAASPGVEAKTTLHDTVIELQVGILRRDEFLRLEALAEVPVQSAGNYAKHPALALASALTFEHRITGTGRIRQREAPAWSVGPKKKLAAVIVALMTMALILFPTIKSDLHSRPLFAAVYIASLVLAGAMVMFPVLDSMRLERAMKRIIGFKEDPASATTFSPVGRSRGAEAADGKRSRSHSRRE